MRLSPRFPLAAAVLALLMTTAFAARTSALELQEFDVPRGSHPHDVAPAPDGTVWYTAQLTGKLGRLDPATGQVREVPLGKGSAPHGVIVGPDGAAWVTDGGQNAIVRVDAGTHAVSVFPLESAYANLNTAAFDRDDTLWFTGQSGIYGRLKKGATQPEVFKAPRGRGPYGIVHTADGSIYFASLAGSYVGRIHPPDPMVTLLEPPTPQQGARRVWGDSRGCVWVSEWDGGRVGVYDPSKGTWREWKLPGQGARPYAIYVDEHDQVWLSDFGSNAIVRFDPKAERFHVYPLPTPGSAVRQMLGRPGEVWAAASGVDKLIVLRPDK